MPLNIRSREVDELASRLASCLGTSKTEAVRRALEHELQRVTPGSSMEERIRAIQQRVLSRPATGLEADKAFYDSLNDE